MKKTPEEFARDYSAKSNVAMESLASYDFVVLPCDCGEGTCQGWQMQDLQWIKTRKSLDLWKKGTPVYPLKDMLGGE